MNDVFDGLVWDFGLFWIRKIVVDGVIWDFWSILGEEGGWVGVREGWGMM